MAKKANKPGVKKGTKRGPYNKKKPPVNNTPVNNTPVDTTPVDTTPVDTTPVDTTPVDTTPVTEKTDFNSIFKEFDLNLDEDSREIKEVEQVIPVEPGDGLNIKAELTNSKAQKYSGASLVLLTDLVFSVVSSLAVRIISKGAKRVEPKQFRADSFEREILEEFGDEAADEVLSGVSKPVLYFVLALSLYGHKVMDKIDFSKKTA